MSTRSPHATALSDEEWEILQPLVPNAKLGGRPRAHHTRELLNAIFYVLRGGCAWRLLFHEFSLPWKKTLTTTSGRGESTAPGSVYTPPLASGCVA
jgi:transposase